MVIFPRIKKSQIIGQNKTVPAQVKKAIHGTQESVKDVHPSWSYWQSFPSPA